MIIYTRDEPKNIHELLKLVAPDAGQNPLCYVFSPSNFICTREHGHNGFHVAWGMRQAIEIWDEAEALHPCRDHPYIRGQ